MILTSALSAETSLKNYGFNGIEILGADQLVCETIIIPQSEEAGHGIISIYASFLGEIGDNTFVKVIFDDSIEQLIWPENFSCKTDCIARVFTPFLNKDVKTTICLNSGGKAINSKIFANSLIGIYNTPVLEIEHISPGEIVLGERAKMLIKVKNRGNLPADIFVQFLAEDLRTFLKITSFDIVEGDASAKTTLKVGEEKEFIYYIKPTNTSAYNLPSAVLTFDNIFNETQKITSNHPQLDVIDQKRLNLLAVGGELSDDEFNFKILVKNNWATSFEGKLSITPFDLINDYSSVISLKPFEEKEFLFSTKNLNPGHYSILAQIDTNNDFFVSESLEFTVNKRDYSFEILFSTIALFIAMAIFAWIYFQKN
jgi:hypothetical protein